MISLESEVLQRHLPLFSGKSILLAGGINDDFPQILQKHCQSVQIWSLYFDYAKTQSAVVFVRKNGINRNDAQSRFCQFHHKVQAVFQLNGHHNDFHR